MCIIFDMCIIFNMCIINKMCILFKISNNFIGIGTSPMPGGSSEVPQRRMVPNRSSQFVPVQDSEFDPSIHSRPSSVQSAASSPQMGQSVAPNSRQYRPVVPSGHSPLHMLSHALHQTSLNSQNAQNMVSPPPVTPPPHPQSSHLHRESPTHRLNRHNRQSPLSHRQGQIYNKKILKMHKFSNTIIIM